MQILHRAFLLLLLFSSTLVWAGSSSQGHANAQKREIIQAARVWPSPEGARVVLDLSGPVQYSYFKLDKPDRIVIDIKNAKTSKNFRPKNVTGKLVKKIRSAKRGISGYRIVLDLTKSIKPAIFQLPPRGPYGARLIIDLEDPEKKAIISLFSPRKPEVSSKHQVSGKDILLFQTRDYMVAIDAGHGGDDPGAIGPRGTREKQVVLQIAKKLADQISREPGIRAFLVRQGDYYIPLRKRMQMARRNGADLFVSIHADGFKDPRASGASVFTLSERGATSEAARWLAEKENDSDLIGGGEYR